MKANVKRIYDVLSALPKESAENLVERMFLDYHELVEAFGEKLDDYMEAYLMSHCPYKAGDAVFLDAPVMVSGSPDPIYPKALGKIQDIVCKVSVEPDEVISCSYRISLMYPVNSTMEFPEKAILGKASDTEILHYMNTIKNSIHRDKDLTLLSEQDPSSRVN